MDDPQYLVTEADDLHDSHQEDGNDSEEGIDQIRDQDRWGLTKHCDLIFRCAVASLYEVVSVRPSVRRSVGPHVPCYFRR